MRFLFSDEAPLCATWGPPNWRSRFIPGTKPCLATALSIVCYLLARCRLLAHSGHDAMSDLSPLSGVERKLDFGAVRSPFDPETDIPRLFP